MGAFRLNLFALFLLPFQVSAQAPASIDWSLPNAAETTAINDCYNNGNCSNMPTGQFRIYPVACSGGLCNGCYRYQDRNYQRVGDLGSSGSCTAADSSLLRVYSFFRTECPSGSGNCTGTGRLILGCRLEKVASTSSADNLDNINIGCFSGQFLYITRGRSSIGPAPNSGGGGATVSNGCESVPIGVSAAAPEIASNGADGTTGAIRVTVRPADVAASPQPSVVVAGATGPVTTDAGSVRTWAFTAPSGPYTAAVSFKSLLGAQCLRQINLTVPARDPCPMGWAPVDTSTSALAASSACQQCAPGFYKDTVANTACIGCGSKFQIAPNNPSVVTPATATSPAGSTTREMCTFTCNGGRVWRRGYGMHVAVHFEPPVEGIFDYCASTRPPPEQRCSYGHKDALGQLVIDNLPPRQPPGAYVLEYYIRGRMPFPGTGSATNINYNYAINPEKIYTGCTIIHAESPTSGTTYYAAGRNFSGFGTKDWSCWEQIGGTLATGVSAYWRPTTGCTSTGYAKPCNVRTSPTLGGGGVQAEQVLPPEQWKLMVRSGLTCNP